ncbi:MAG: hypothetical protein AB7S36_00155 [Planctomycetota bacterium]
MAAAEHAMQQIPGSLPPRGRLPSRTTFVEYPRSTIPAEGPIRPGGDIGRGERRRRHYRLWRMTGTGNPTLVILRAAAIALGVGMLLAWNWLYAVIVPTSGSAVIAVVASGTTICGLAYGVLLLAKAWLVRRATGVAAFAHARKAGPDGQTITTPLGSNELLRAREAAEVLAAVRVVTMVGWLFVAVFAAGTTALMIARGGVWLALWLALLAGASVTGLARLLEWRGGKRANTVRRSSP